MNKTLEIGRSGMLAHARSLEKISHNMANIETVGFKKQDSVFRGLLKNAMKSDSVAMSPAMPDHERNQGVGVGTGRDWTDFSQGGLKQTEGHLDLAIDGEGFFRLQDNNGSSYLTRKGAFTQDAQGHIVDARGYHLDIEWIDGLSEEKKLDFSIRLADQASVVIFDPETEEWEAIGRVPLYTTVNTNVLRANQGYYLLDDETRLEALDLDEAQAQSQVWSGFLEGANVDIIQTMTDMIIAQRAYQLSAKSVTAADGSMEVYNRLL